LGVGGGDEATTGGDGGRRDGENIGRARVSVSAPRGTAHKGLPVNEVSVFPRRGIGAGSMGRRSPIASGATAVISPGCEPASVRAPPNMKNAAARSALARQIGQPAKPHACRSAAMTKLAIANRGP
jgi:hypothetical protein